MRQIVITTTEFEKAGREQIGKRIIHEIVPPVMRAQADAYTVGWLVQTRIEKAGKQIKVRIGYEDGRFYNMTRDGERRGPYLYSIRAR